MIWDIADKAMKEFLATSLWLLVLKSYTQGTHLGEAF